jgi:transposase
VAAANARAFEIGHSSAANVHDSKALKPMVLGHQTRHDPHDGRCFKPRRLRADKAYDIPELRKWARGKYIGVRIALKGIESGERLGRRRWVIERTMSWLTGYRRLHRRYERKAEHFLASPPSPAPASVTADSPNEMTYEANRTWPSASGWTTTKVLSVS